MINYWFHTVQCTGSPAERIYETAWVGTKARAGVGQTRPRLGRTLRFPTTMFSLNSKTLPQRTHSVNAVKHANYFGSIDEELRDCKRVQRQGQEEDLREALGRMMARVEEMVRSSIWILLMLPAITPF